MPYFCRFCMESANDNDDLKFVNPCKCKSDSEWVHTECLTRWESVKEEMQSRRLNKCELCLYSYKTVRPPLPISLTILRVAGPFLKFLADGCGKFLTYCSMYCLTILLILIVMQHIDGGNINISELDTDGLPIFVGILVAFLFIEVIPCEYLTLYILTKCRMLSQCITKFDTFVQYEYKFRENENAIVGSYNLICRRSDDEVLHKAFLVAVLSEVIGHELYYLLWPNRFFYKVAGILTFLAIRTAFRLYGQYMEHKYRYSVQYIPYYTPDNEYNEERALFMNSSESEYASSSDSESSEE